MSRLSSLLRNLFRKRRVEKELDEEVRSYLDLLAQENIKAGMSQEAARREPRAGKTAHRSPIEI